MKTRPWGGAQWQQEGQGAIRTGRGRGDMLVRTFSLSTQGQKDPSEFEARLVYDVSSRPAMVR